MFELISVPPLLMMGVAAHVALHHAMVGCRQERGALHWTFALTALLSVPFDLMTALLYSAGSWEEAARYQQGQFLLMSPFSVALLWFGSRFLELPRGRGLWVATAILGSFSLALLLSPGMILALGERLPAYDVVCCGQVLTTYREAPLRLGGQVALAALVSTFVWLTAHAWAAWRTGGRWGAGLFFWAMVLYLLTAINDALLAARLIHSVYLAEFGFFALVLAMNAILSEDFGRAKRTNRQLEDRLAHTHRLEAIGRLAAGVAHDFNNLLTPIMTYAELIHDAAPPGDPTQQDAKVILDAASQAKGLTGQLLAYGRKQRLQVERLDLGEVVRDALPLLRSALPREVELVLDLMEGRACVRADKVQIQQVLLNLVTNAADAMPKGGRVVIRTSLEARAGGQVAVRLSCADTGHGMSPEVAAHIFEPFFTTKEVSGDRGSGLGLATVYGVVHQLGGEIRVRSAEGEGTRFDLWFTTCLAA
ncbi:MAG: hypothetical protein JXX28_15485 [Deltaproteobacteria bacterium]|nr:hypothetical protein [Deltaproteobacteria bacterium]